MAVLELQAVSLDQSVKMDDGGQFTMLSKNQKAKPDS